MAKKGVEVVDVLFPKLVGAITYLVDKLPRGKRADGTPYTGLRQDRCQLVPLFFAYMAKIGHPLANVTNERCNYKNPCGECRRDVFDAAWKAAEANGSIIRQGREGRQYEDERGRMVQGKGYVVFYRPGEAQTANGAGLLDEMVAKL